MATPQYAYDFDPYGDNPNNRITGERHTITPANGKDFNYFVPNFAPFHRRNFIMHSVVNGVVGGELKATTDFYFGFRYDQMILSGSMEPIYGAIVFNDPQFGGDVSIDYGTLGAEYTLSTAQVATLLANNQLDPRVTQWTSVTGAPTTVPPVPHKHNAMQTMVGMDALVDSIYVVIDSISVGFNKAFQALQEHLKDHNNPHQVTARQVGVDGNGSLVPADQGEAEAGVDNNKYMTSLRVLQSIQANALPVIQAHITDSTNPHKVTADQVGLGLVSNYPIASATESEAGVATNRYMTPAAVLAAMSYRVPLIMQTHTTDTNNPHKTTAAQVGLGNVPNFPTATVQEAISGTSNATLMTPYLVAQAVATGSSQGLAAHILDVNNPHKVTAAQVGLGNVGNYSLATVAQAQAGTDTTSYMSPYLVSVMLASNVGGSIDAHIADHNNPHQVTAAQVGLGKVPNYPKAAAADAVAGTSDVMLMTPYLVAQAIAVGVPQALSAHVADTANPHQVTAAQVGLGNVPNYGMAALSDMKDMSRTDAFLSPAHVGELFRGTFQDKIDEALGSAGNVTPIFTRNGLLFPTINNRFPYEYTFIKPSYDNGRWAGDATGLHPVASPTVFSAVYNAAQQGVVPDAGLSGVLDIGSATMFGLIIGTVPLAATGDLDDGTGYIMLEVVGTTLTLIHHDPRNRTRTPLAGFAPLTLGAPLGAGASWSADPTWDASGKLTLVTGAIGGKTYSVNITNLVNETVVGAALVSSAIGFALTAPDSTTRIRVVNWLKSDIYYRDLSQPNLCYTYADGAWNPIDVSAVIGKTVAGAWYYNRFSGESWGAISTEEVVPLGRKPLVSSDEIIVTETATGYQLTLSGNVKRDLAMGDQDITFNM